MGISQSPGRRQRGVTPALHSEFQVSACRAMAGGGEVERLGVELHNSVRFPHHAYSALLSIHTARFPLLWRLSILGVFAAFGHGGGRQPSHVPLFVGDPSHCSGTFGSRTAPSAVISSPENVSIDTAVTGIGPHAACACT